MFHQDEGTGLLTLTQIQPTIGQTPRDVQFTADGAWLVAALQTTDTLESYRVDAENGRLIPGTAGFPVPSPACIAQ